MLETINKPNTRVKFEFLDGLRGVSALFVVTYHALLFTGRGVQEATMGGVRLVQELIKFGDLSVSVFIVLSGFCLAIPVATSADQQLRGGFRRYMQRRFKRIVPPYYVALIGSLLLIYYVPVLQTPAGTAWDSKLPVTAGSVLSHFFLVHNWNEAWIVKINGAMWSVATEWQIYFLFPLLIYLKNRYNLLVSVMAAFALGMGGMLAGLSFAHPQYVGLFAMGMAGSMIAFGKTDEWVRFRAWIPWKVVNIVTGMVAIVTLVLIRYAHLHPYFYENSMGLVIAVQITRMVLAQQNAAAQGLAYRNLWTAPWALAAGTFSYSLYLVHGPLLGLSNLVLLRFGLSYDWHLMLMWGLVVPLVTLIGYGFYHLIEKHFQNS